MAHDLSEAQLKALWVTYDPTKHRKPKKTREEDSNAKTWTEFRYCKNKCMSCNSCGWFYGPGHDKFPGKPAVFGIYK
jgi:hypothetical protein